MGTQRLPFYYRIAAGIRITVRPQYLTEESEPEHQSYLFSYRIRIENVSDRTVQLRSRYWLIHDELAGDRVVEGTGVVGEEPVLRPGEVFEYESFCELKGPNGWMEGAYHFSRDDGGRFEAPIPRFPLVVGWHTSGPSD